METRKNAPSLRAGKSGLRFGTTIATTRLKTTSTAPTTARMISFVLTCGTTITARVGRVSIYVASAAAFLVAVALAAARVGEQPGALSGWQALALGSVQGFTELLPISSSGHLILVPWLADWRYLEVNDTFNKTFDVALHLGTLVAVVAYFWRDIVRLLVALGGSLRRRRIDTPDARVAWFVVVATIPAVIAGGLGESAIQEHLGEPWQIAVFLSVFAMLLLLADRSRQERRMA